VIVGAITVALAIIGTIFLAVLGIFAILAGIVLTFTVVGAIIGIPLLLLGMLAIAGAFIGGAGGIFFALLLGAGVGFLYYRHRVKSLARRT